jgi:hypothetical protein
MSNIQLQENDTENIIQLSNNASTYDITLTDGQDASIDVSLYGNDTNVSINILSSENNTSELKLFDSNAWEYAEECRQIRDSIINTLDNIRSAGNIEITRDNDILTIGTKNYFHDQNVASDIWHIEHNLGKQYVNVIVVDSAGNKYYPAIDYTSDTECYVFLKGATTGTAFVE